MNSKCTSLQFISYSLFYMPNLTRAWAHFWQCVKVWTRIIEKVGVCRQLMVTSRRKGNGSREHILLLRSFFLWRRRGFGSLLQPLLGLKNRHIGVLRLFFEVQWNDGIFFAKSPPPFESLPNWKFKWRLLRVLFSRRGCLLDTFHEINYGN